MLVKRGNVTYFTTRGEAMTAAKECMRLVKKFKPWTGPWKRDDADYEFFSFPKNHLPDWEATDGLIEWGISVDIDVKNGLSLYHVWVTMAAEDQMYYNWSVPADGSPEDVIRCCLGARQVDVDQGEQWRWLGCLDVENDKVVMRGTISDRFGV